MALVRGAARQGLLGPGTAFLPLPRASIYPEFCGLQSRPPSDLSGIRYLQKPGQLGIHTWGRLRPGCEVRGTACVWPPLRPRRLLHCVARGVCQAGGSHGASEGTGVRLLGLQRRPSSHSSSSRRLSPCPVSVGAPRPPTASSAHKTGKRWCL